MSCEQRTTLKLFKKCSRMSIGTVVECYMENILFYNSSSEGHKICCRKVLELEKF